MHGSEYVAHQIHPDAVLHVQGNNLRGGDLAFWTVYKGEPTPRCDLPPEVVNALIDTLRNNHPRHYSYFFEGK